MERLTKRPTGTHILQTLHINYKGRLGEKHDIPPDIRGHIHIPPLPRNMHPEHNMERRQARAQALDKRFAHLEDVVYVDAADYSLTDRAVVTNIFDAHSFRRSDRDRLVAYRDVINLYRLGRAKYPAADRTLSKWQAVALNPGEQVRLVQMAEAAAKEQGLLAAV
ncbi:hypothetical protein HPB47_006821 [Ixodes persulcatus]|uniref:Uncharacterized protein n=1 Tax=Ixodes persulcatus TaxID=34615 RepID=A0AC60P9C6_IXOPE|nr:hypothetical protein HPB47_006821 [Ixodes persulcatus]